MNFSSHGYQMQMSLLNTILQIVPGKTANTLLLGMWRDTYLTTRDTELGSRERDEIFRLFYRNPLDEICREIVFYSPYHNIKKN